MQEYIKFALMEPAKGNGAEESTEGRTKGDDDDEEEDGAYNIELEYLNPFVLASSSGVILRRHPQASS